MDERQSDDETLEFDIEVVSSSSSASIVLEGDIELEPDCHEDEQEEKQLDEDAHSDKFRIGEHENSQANEKKCEIDTKEVGERSNHEPETIEKRTLDQNEPADCDRKPAVDLIDGVHQEHLKQTLRANEQNDISATECQEETKATSAASEEWQLTVTDDESSPKGDEEGRSLTGEQEQEREESADEIPVEESPKNARKENPLRANDHAGGDAQQEQESSADEERPIVTSPACLGPEDDLTNNQNEFEYEQHQEDALQENSLGALAPSTEQTEEQVKHVEADGDGLPLDGDLYGGKQDTALLELVAIEFNLVRELFECPTGWLLSDDLHLECVAKVEPFELAPAQCIEASTICRACDEDQRTDREDRLACAPPEPIQVNVSSNEVPQNDSNVGTLEVGEVGSQPKLAESQIVNDEGGPGENLEGLPQHQRVDISVHLEEVPDVERDQVSPTSVQESSNLIEVDSDSQHSSSLHQFGSSVRRSSSAHLLVCALEDEDLEREFDEEPEFEPRDVQVKRNRNPRDEYQLGSELGRGKFGTVLRCTEKASGRELAAKFIHMRRREDREDVEREVAIMSVLQHKRLLQLYDAFDDGIQEMCLITELVEGGELFERIVDDDFDLTEKKAAIFMRQICEGVQYMHSQQIVHLDMKPENILCLSRTGIRIKLIDFGLARRLDPSKPTRVMFGTPDFAAPEVLGYETITLATDMWSVGVICYVLLSGLSPFMGDNDLETMANVMRATFDFNDQAFEAISDLAKDFIAKLLVREASERLKPAECLKHAWLQRGGAPLEAAIRERRESSAVMISAHHRLALEQAALAAAAAATAGASAEQTPQTPPTGFGAAFNQSRASFGAESTASSGGMYSLDKRRLKKYVVRRKWHKTVHAIMALGRMGANLSFKL